MASNQTVEELLKTDNEEQRWLRIGDFVREDAAVAQFEAENLLSSDPASDRRLGAEILGQLAATHPGARGQITSRLLAALDADKDAGAIAAIVVALGFAAHPRSRAAIQALSVHPDARVRFAVAFSLPILAMDEEALETLRLLSNDVDDDVRDWATFALAESDASDSNTRESLIGRTTDADDDTRAEAIYGLARRRDPVAYGLIERELTFHPGQTLVRRAREELRRKPR